MNVRIDPVVSVAARDGEVWAQQEIMSVLIAVVAGCFEAYGVAHSEYQWMAHAARFVQQRMDVEEGNRGYIAFASCHPEIVLETLERKCRRHCARPDR